MRFAIIGRTSALIAAAETLIHAGHTLGLVWTCREEPFYTATHADFKELARRNSVPFRNDLEINSTASRQFLKNEDCDIGVSLNWLTLLSEETIGCFAHGVLNAHCGDLPRYRGNACPNWAILNKEADIALCIHKMVAQLDAGDVVLRRRMALTDTTYIGDVYNWLDDVIPSAFATAIDSIDKGIAAPHPQDPKQPGLRCYPRRASDARIDWTQPNDAILRLIRASGKPFDGAFTSLEGKQKIVIWRAELYKPVGDFCAIPGQVCFVEEGNPIIACGEGMLRLTHCQADNAKEDHNKTVKLIASSLRNRLW